MLDEKLDKKMFRPDVKKMETRMSCAAIEACKAKKLYGALRALWRSSNVNGADARITHLKSFVAPSPKRDEVEGEGETERPDESHPAVVPLAPLRDASESDDVGSGGESDDEDVSTREEPCEIEPSQPPRMIPVKVVTTGIPLRWSWVHLIVIVNNWNLVRLLLMEMGCILLSLPFL